MEEHSWQVSRFFIDQSFQIEGQTFAKYTKYAILGVHLAHCSALYLPPSTYWWQRMF